MFGEAHDAGNAGAGAALVSIILAFGEGTQLAFKGQIAIAQQEQPQLLNRMFPVFGCDKLPDFLDDHLGIFEQGLAQTREFDGDEAYNLSDGQSDLSTGQKHCPQFHSDLSACFDEFCEFLQSAVNDGTLYGILKENEVFLMTGVTTIPPRWYRPLRLGWSHSVPYCCEHT